MAVTALAWNIEDLGTRYGLTAAGLACEAVRCGLIAEVVADAGAEVLVIQELHPQGVALLATLQTALNAATGQTDWHYDWLPGSIASGGALPPTTINDLAFTPEGHREGYAILYRATYAQQQGSGLSAGQDTAIRVLPANASYIDLVLSGKPIEFYPSDPVIRFDANGAATALGFPSSTCSDANISYGLKKRVTNSGASILQQRLVRRPCLVNLVDPNVTLAQPLSLVVYHAPVGQNGSKSHIYGTLIGFAATALAPAAGARGYLGDFNVTGKGDLMTLHNRAATLNFIAETGGSGVYMNTSVHAAVGATGPWHQGTGVLTSPRDIGLGTAANATGIPDVLGSFNVVGAGANTFLMTAANQAFITTTLLPAAAANFPGNAAAVLAAFFAGGGYPANTDVSTGRALVFNLVLSDHLPVRIVQ
jgi:hypothetical protein